MTSQKKLYLVLALLCLGGYGLLFLNLLGIFPHDEVGTVCIFKNVTSIPCPSCGSTRSALQILQGNFTTALLINPLGYLVLSVLTFLPLWLLYDLIRKTNSFYLFYSKAIRVVVKKPVAIILVVLLLTNWIWNIVKDL